MENLELAVGAEAAGIRFDQFLHRSVTGISRHDVQRLILLSGVRSSASGALQRIKGRQVELGDRFVVDPSVLDERPQDERRTLARKRHDVLLLAEGDDWAVLRKPAGLGSVARFWGDTLHFAAYAREIMEQRRQDFRGDALKDCGLVHRLDFGTSGGCVLGRDARALAELIAQRERGDLSRTYWAIVANGVPGEGTIDEPIAHHPRDPASMVVVSDAGRRQGAYRGEPQPAQTRFTVLARSAEKSLLEVTLVGGRRHQIRVHLASLGYPVLGDGLYGPLAAERLALHATYVRFTAPGGSETVVVGAEPGDHFWTFAPTLVRDLE